VKITTLIILLLGIATARGAAMIVSVKKEGLRGSTLLIIRPARVVTGATVFVIGILAGASIAMWVMPPV
jgi:hypothetical protein